MLAIIINYIILNYMWKILMANDSDHIQVLSFVQEIKEINFYVPSLIFREPHVFDIKLGDDNVF